MNDQVAGPIEYAIRNNSDNTGSDNTGTIGGNLNRIDYLLEDLEKVILNLETRIQPILNINMPMPSDPSLKSPSAEATSGMAGWTDRIADTIFRRIETIKEIERRVDL